MSIPFPAGRPPPSLLRSRKAAIAKAPASKPFLFALPPTKIRWSIPSRSPKRALNWILQYNSKRGTIPLAMNSAASGESDGPLKWNTHVIMYAHKMFDELPQPVKNFPWSNALWSFQNIILELLFFVAKFLSLPLLVVTSLSEMSYCAQERRMGVIPISFFLGFALAGILKDAAMELLDGLKEGGFPWHLFLISSLFILLKLLGPYYPYWGRLLVPHFANGALLRTVWFTYLWYKRPFSGSDLK